MKILSALKHFFFPHHENDFKPHFFREKAVGVMILAGVFLMGISFTDYVVLRKTEYGEKTMSMVLVDLANESREKEGKKPLVFSSLLREAAKLKGDDMASKGYFAHRSPEGVSPWHWLTKVNYSFLYAGENLAVDFDKSEEINNAWLNSPSHRLNILKDDFREIGVATVYGFYNDHPTLFVVQMFGTPKSSEILLTSTTSLVSLERINLPQTSLSKVTEGRQKENVSPCGDINCQAIFSTNESSMVKTEGAEKESFSLNIKKEVYSTWHQRIMFNISHYIDFLNKMMVITVAVLLILMVFIEVKKQHYVHVLYGISLLCLSVLFTYINQGFL